MSTIFQSLTEIVAGALAAAAGLGEDLAVFHTVLGVLVALVVAEAAGSGADGAGLDALTSAAASTVAPLGLASIIC